MTDESFLDALLATLAFVAALALIIGIAALVLP